MRRAPGRGGRALTYPEVGASLTEELPRGYRHQRDRVRLGTGRALFERSAAAVTGWELHRRAGVRPAPGTPPAAAGSDVDLTAALGPLVLRMSCRVVAVVDEPDRRGFAYGTLTGHPERGEEAFVVHRDADDAVWLEVVAFSRPGRWYTRLGGPLARAAQRAATRRYLRALVERPAAPLP
ncbi:DUF1990 family protein [Cellulomonas cellasea]|uniref:Uncharacterized protein (UPF0548 family) n=1 Tax=Cellulomonas cellasea TaxID=43670 RepID=A0A7W4UC29_9CELL|nr:DUF1990 domain-containing protein [Cellulomonas cellasea]MBB2921466.1 uncharacterized protein (UPF0548 family) [Cellulomonas cellasea]